MSSKLDRVKDLLLSGGVIDVLGLSETHLSPSVLSNDLQIPGYSLLGNDRITDTYGGGTAFYCRSGLRPKLEESTKQAVGCTGEQLWISVNLRRQKGRFHIGCFYRPPTSCAKDFIQQLRESVEVHMATNSPFVFGGDSNIDLFKPSTSTSKEYTEMLASLHMLQKIVTATRIDLARSTSTCIDHVIVHESMVCKQVGSISVDLADHELTYLILDLETPNCTTYRWLRSMRSFDSTAFRQDVETADYKQFWDAIQASDIDLAVSLWTETFSAIVNRHAPLKLTKLKKHHQPWVSPDIRNWRQEAANLHFRAKKAAAQGDAQVTTLRSQWRECQDVVDAMEKEAKLSYFATRIEEAGPNS